MPVFAILWKYRAVLVWVAALLAVILLSFRVMAWHRAYEELPDVKEALDAEVGCKEGSACAERVAEVQRANEITNQEAVAKYEQEIADLRERPPVPHRVIRVCPPAGNVRDAAGTGGTGQGPAAPGVVPGPVELDTRPLFAIADEADAVSARCRALLERDRKLAKANRSK